MFDNVHGYLGKSNTKIDLTWNIKRMMKRNQERFIDKFACLMVREWSGLGHDTICFGSAGPVLILGSYTS